MSDEFYIFIESDDLEELYREYRQFRKSRSKDIMKIHRMIYIPIIDIFK